MGTELDLQGNAYVRPILPHLLILADLANKQPLDTAHSHLLSLLHCIPTSNDCNCQKASTSSIHHIHRRRLGSRDSGTWSGENLAPDARASCPARYSRGWLFLHFRLLGQHLVYQKYERLSTPTHVKILTNIIGEVAKRNSSFYLLGSMLGGFGGILAYGVSLTYAT